MSLFEKIRVVIKEEDAKNPKKSKAQNYSDKINKQNKNRKEFKFDPKSKERQTFRSVVQSGDKKGRGYTIHRGDVKKGETKGIRKSQLTSDNFKNTIKPSGKMDPAWKDFSKRATKGEPKAIQFGIDLKKDFRKERGLGKRAERVTGASGGKKTGALRKGNLSFPGDRTGAYSTTKSQIEFDKALKKARGNTEGDIPREAPKDVKDYAKGVRDERIKKYKLPDTSFDAKTKFSQKNFEKSLGGAKKSTTAAPGLFGKGDTKGQMNVKAMDKKTFKVTKPKDVKLPKSFSDFQKNLQDYKDRDKATMRTGKSSSKVKVSGANNLSRQDVGMAPPDKPKTKVVKQSEVSKKAKDFAKKIDQKRVSSSGYSQANKPKPGSEPAVFKPKGVNAKVVNTTPFDDKSGTVKKNKVTKNLTRTNKGFKEPRTIAKKRSTIFNPPDYSKSASYYKSQGKDAFDLSKNPITKKVSTSKGPQLPKFLDLKTGNIKKTFKKGDINYQKLSQPNRAFARSGSAVVKKSPKALKPVVSGIVRAGTKLGRGGRLGLLGGTIAAISSPAGRRLIRNALGFTGLAYFGNKALKKPPTLKVGDGITKVSNMPSKYQPPGMKSGTFKEPGSNKVRGTGDVRVRFGLTGSKKNKDGTITPGGRIANPKDMSRVKNIQKRYIDSYNASAKNNPLKKQIKYSVNKDGSYTVTPPKKK